MGFGEPHFLRRHAETFVSLSFSLFFRLHLAEGERGFVREGASKETMVGRAVLPNPAFRFPRCGLLHLTFWRNPCFVIPFYSLWRAFRRRMLLFKHFCFFNHVFMLDPLFQPARIASSFFVLDFVSGWTFLGVSGNGD